MFTRGRLVPRQPRAIKRTTRTELRRCDIRNDKCIHWNIDTTPTALHHEGIHNGRYIHGNIDINSTALHCYHIHNAKYIHWNTSIKHVASRRCDIHNGEYIHWDTGTTPTAICTAASFVCKQIVCYGIVFLSTLLFNPR